MKNQKGFTLVELMVVIAIIAIMATAGITQYSGFLKTARDNTRIQDLKAIETFVVSEMALAGLSPDSSDAAEFNAALKKFSGKTFVDPSSGGKACLNDEETPETCAYEYAQCDEGGGYVIRMRFEDDRNVPKYDADEYGGEDGKIDYYEVGNCLEYPGDGSFITIEGAD